MTMTAMDSPTIQRQSQFAQDSVAIPISFGSNALSTETRGERLLRLLTGLATLLPSPKTPDVSTWPPGGFMVVKPESMDDGTVANRRSWAWADPDNAFNVDELVNNNPYPRGGPPGCTWDIVNCGPNEETFSFHPQGANVNLCDGSVQFLEASIDAIVFTAIMSKDGGEVDSFF